MTVQRLIRCGRGSEGVKGENSMVEVSKINYIYVG